jgi:hypothetical protein
LLRVNLLQIYRLHAFQFVFYGDYWARHFELVFLWAFAYR